MDHDLLVELSKTNTLLTVIAIMLFLLLSGKVFEVIGNITNNLNTYRTTKVRGIAAEKHSKGDYSELNAFLEKELNNYPNCPTTVYWMARCQLSLSDYAKAKILFLKLKELEPSWETEYVSPYLKEIEEKH